MAFGIVSRIIAPQTIQHGPPIRSNHKQIMDKKKLLFFHPLIGPYRVDFVNALFEAFDTKVYLTLQTCSGLAFNQEDSYAKLHFTPVFLPNAFRGKFRIIWRELISYAPDIVITTEFDTVTLFMVLWRLITRKRFKLVSLSDDSYDMLTREGSTFRHRLARRLLARHLDDIILIEPKTVNWYQGKYGIGSFFPIIRNEKIATGIYEKSIPFIRKNIGALQLEKKYVFLYAGRLVPIKNVSLLIDAFSFFDQSTNALIIVGDGIESARLQQKAKGLGLTNVHFTGALREETLYAWYLVADTFVLPSISEPFGAVTNEALLGGCSAVVSDRAGSRCLIEEGKNGYLFNPASVFDLREKMLLSQQLSRSDSEAGRGRSSKMVYKFDILFNALRDRLYSL